jgi:DnaJ domain
VSAVPAEIGGIGSTQQKLRVAPSFDPLKAQVGPDEYFLLSQIDGTQTLRELLLGNGLPVDRGIAIVAKLRALGALLLPGETTANVVANNDVGLPDPTPAEQRALAEDNALSPHIRKKVLALARLAADPEPDSYALLGVTKDISPDALKRAYYLLAKEIHPDRYFGKRLGSFGPRLSTVFEAASRAYQRLQHGAA